MKSTKGPFTHRLICFVISLFVVTNNASAEEITFQLRLEKLGQSLFFDVNLSKNRRQACATCHDPDWGFTDPRDNGVHKMASLGDDRNSIGDRQAPAIAYAAFAPVFHQTDKGVYKGGQFWDGRAATLEQQAGGPPLNLAEMGMTNPEEILERLVENEFYVKEFQHLFGEDILDDAPLAYTRMTEAIAAYERTDFFAPFDSKYDRFLRGEASLSTEEELGRILFFSAQFTNCNHCHQLHSIPGSAQETFTNYEYHNIGVPENIALRAANGIREKDAGLFANPAIDDPQHRGKFKTPGLRNVAITAPYMHNGVFADLETVIRFYNKYNSLHAGATINPETGKEWGPPEHKDTMALTELKKGDALDDRRIKALVAFMKTLTDRRFEHLLRDE